MTVGQRIAHKRKELSLSQEGLGEQLGVSRQAIYKWESDVSLPEIEKLIALSRIFGVSVGWLLGVEEDVATPADRAELTETQMNMVKEIVDRYLAAQPAPEEPKRRRWPKVLIAAAGIVLVLVLINLFERLDQLGNQYGNLQSSIGNIQNNVAYQIGSITDRVEEVLKTQNNLTSDYNTTYDGMDETGSLASFSWRARPRTYEEGMVAWVDVVSGSETGERTTFGPYAPEREAFSGSFTVELTDYTAIYVVFEHTDGVKQTQLLDTHEGLYSSSFPVVYPDSFPLFFSADDATDTFTEDLEVTLDDDGIAEGEIVSCRVGLFADRELVEWFVPSTRTVYIEYDSNRVEQTQQECYRLACQGMALDRSKVYAIAVVVVDRYGREFVVSDMPMQYQQDSGWTHPNMYSSGLDFNDWSYE